MPTNSTFDALSKAVIARHQRIQAAAMVALIPDYHRYVRRQQLMDSLNTTDGGYHLPSRFEDLDGSTLVGFCYGSQP